jgi:DnaK suppressor protein
VTTKTTKKTTGQSSVVPAVAATAGTLLSKVPAAVAKPDTKVARKNVRYSDKDLNFFRVNIERSREEAIEELRMLKERLDDLTSSEANEDSSIYSMHMAEQGSEAQEKEKTYAQIQRIQDYIRKLDESLQRIADKTYGICRMCGILIARERLLAVPITTLSASYKIHQTCPADGVDRIVAKGGSALKP